MLPLPSMQLVNQEGIVVTNGQIQAKLFGFTFSPTVWQDQVGVVDGAGVKPSIFMAWKFTKDANI